ncbi:MAG: hypothetical protein AMJ95_04720 [Omnitrophica WOR_2 bacterium SM23_72]|nr:MAG: hypothetical protein AMJ95_04720 [Omnitrophica WOR_2 bacterium SM23_72]
MKKIRISIFVFVLMVLLHPLCFAERYINPSIPIQVNDTIYFEDSVRPPSGMDAVAIVSIRFIYLGMKDNQLVFKRIDHQWSKEKGSKDRERIINVFLINNQGKLKVKPKTERLTATQLIITVMDDSYGIKVEEAE